MRKLLFIALLLGIAALAAAFTRPSEADVEAELKAQFLERLASTNPSASEDGGSFALTMICKADHDACWEVVRGGLDVTYDDRKLYAAIDVVGFGREITCYGAFTQFYCSDEIPVGEG